MWSQLTNLLIVVDNMKDSTKVLMGLAFVSLMVVSLAVVAVAAVKG